MALPMKSDSSAQPRQPWWRQALQLAAIFLPVLWLVMRIAFPPPVPTGRFLVYVDKPGPGNPDSMASATILLFKAGGQYAEYTGFVADSGKGELSLVPGNNSFQVVGTWTQNGRTLTARRKRVARPLPYDGPYLDPLCRSSIVEYRLVGRDGVRDGRTVFKASNQRSIAGWDEYVSKAMSSGASCSVR
jgi:hypothetical protein